MEYSIAQPQNTHVFNTKVKTKLWQALFPDTKTPPPAVVAVKHASCSVARDCIYFLNHISIAFFVLRIMLALPWQFRRCFVSWGPGKKCDCLTDGIKHRVICCEYANEHIISVLCGLSSYGTILCFFHVTYFIELGTLEWRDCYCAVIGGIDSCEIDARQCFLWW